MLSAVLLLTLLALVTWWLSASPLRIGIAAGLVAMTSRGPGAQFVPVAAALLLLATTLILYRAFRATNGRLMTYTYNPS